MTNHGGKREGAGAKPRSRAGAARATIQVRCPADVKAWGDKVAKARGKTLSALLVDYLMSLRLDDARPPWRDKRG